MLKLMEMASKAHTGESIYDPDFITRLMNTILTAQEEAGILPPVVSGAMLEVKNKETGEYLLVGETTGLSDILRKWEDE